jgi:TPR repeat protein
MNERLAENMAEVKRWKTKQREELFLEAARYEEAGDFGRAFRCLLTAAQLGDAGSQLNLGNFYAWGRGTRKNLQKAAYWYKKAYKSGESTGALNLAIDRKVAGNLSSAITWFKKAIAMNNGEACVQLAKLYKNRKGGQKRATQLLTRALRMSRDHISEAAKEEAEQLIEDTDAGITNP